MSRFYTQEDGWVPPKYWFYRPFMRLIHRYGFHYAPKEWPIDSKHVTVGLAGNEVLHWRHWCQWCGLRGETVNIKEMDK